MLYVYAAILIAVLVLVFLIVRWWRLPSTIEQRRLAAEEREKRLIARDEEREKDRKERQERWDARGGLFGWRKRKPK